MSALTDQHTHFAFGENWREFARLIDDERVLQSDQGLSRLLSAGEIEGKTAIDIGCGSGLPALSLLRAGATHVTCVDIDPNSVETTRATLGRYAPSGPWSAEVGSVFDLEGQYDVVYSWGVLHHTGDMWRAIDKAAAMVKPRGQFALAIYCKTRLCGFWRIEKRLYRRLPKPLQVLVNAGYTAWRVLIAGARTGKPIAFMSEGRERGMDWWRDQHDWLGGYPYESATPVEIRAFLEGRGFVPVVERLAAGGRHGLLGSGCDEYVFRRSA